MKKLLLTAALVLSMSVSAFANSIVINGNKIEAQAVIVEGRTLVPVRGIFEALNYNVSWDAETKTATLSGAKTVVIQAGATYFTVDGEEIKPDVPQQIIDGRFMLPLRAISEAIGANVDWDPETKTVTIDVQTGLRVVEVQEL